MVFQNQMDHQLETPQGQTQQLNLTFRVLCEVKLMCHLPNSTIRVIQEPFDLVIPGTIPKSLVIQTKGLLPF